MQAPDLEYNDWTVDQAKSVLQLCKNYANDRGESLGYGGFGGLFVPQSSVPDNLPQILTQTAGRTASQARWYPLFPSRRWPDELLAYSSQTHAGEPAWDKLVARLQGKGFTTNTAWPNRRSEKLLATVLFAASKRLLEPEKLAAVTNVRITDIDRVILLLQELSLLDGDGRITPRGRLELGRLRSRVRRVVELPTPVASPYYPSALRGVGST